MADLTGSQVVDLLALNLQRIDRFQDGQGPEVTATAAPDGGWSMVQVLAHLRCCADVWGAAIGAILDEDSPTLAAMDPRTWAERTDYDVLGWEPSWDAFQNQREDLLERLRGLDADQWERSATVTGAGRPGERTVHYYAERMAVHERTHVDQLGRLAQREVG